MKKWMQSQAITFYCNLQFFNSLVLVVWAILLWSGAERYAIIGVGIVAVITACIEFAIVTSRSDKSCFRIGKDADVRLKIAYSLNALGLLLFFIALFTHKS